MHYTGKIEIAKAFVAGFHVQYGRSVNRYDPGGGSCPGYYNKKVNT